MAFQALLPGPTPQYLNEADALQALSLGSYVNLNASVTYAESVSESGSAADTSSSTPVWAADVGESASASDSSNAAGSVFSAAISESLTATAVVSAGQVYSAAAAESATPTDTVAIGSNVYSDAVVESAAAVDTSDVGGSFSAEVLEALIPVDVSSAVLGGYVWYLSFADVVPPPAGQGPGNPGKLKGDFRFVIKEES